ncbi:MAG: hypothetical protein D9C04_02545 [Nitrosopumilus sp. B06]|nr:MAG: hypothetical protein EB828_01610 [Nitrosopumilus sp. D6]RNJ80136.1 MAG: hypothetical protein D9C04_02545 [Nitrosopumilus sp. B06]
MRLGTKSSDGFICTLNRKNDSIGGQFLAEMATMTEMIDAKVMLGDSTVTTQKTFDPKRVEDYFQKIGSSLKEWSVQGVSTSNDEGLGRTFSKFETTIGSYLLSGHVSVQFHVLLYYKPVQRVIECQKELSDIINITKDGQQQMSDRGDQVVLEKLREMGYKDFDHQKLFEVFYEDDEFREKVYAEIQKDSGEDFQKLLEKKTRLFGELDSLLVETYQTVPVLIDDARLVTGEEGCLCTFDVEFVKNNSKQGLFDPRKIPERIKEDICQKLDEFENILKS